MRAPIIALVLVMSAVQAAAGVWPRAHGGTFLSFGHTASTGTRTLLAPMQELRNYTSIYAEHGLTPETTVGFEAGRGDGEDSTTSTALAFVRRPMWRSEGGSMVAAGFGLGARSDSHDGDQARLRTILAWGRGFESRWGSGWVGVDGALELRLPATTSSFRSTRQPASSRTTARC